MPVCWSIVSLHWEVDSTQLIFQCIVDTVHSFVIPQIYVSNDFFHFLKLRNLPALHLHVITLLTDMQNSVPAVLQSLHFNAVGVGEGVVVPDTSHFTPLYPFKKHEDFA